MIVAFILVLVAVGSVVFHFMSPWWWTPIASNWSYIDHTLIITFWITGVVFTAVVLFTAYCVPLPSPGGTGVVRAREQEAGVVAHHSDRRGCRAMLAPGLLYVNEFVTVPADATEFEVVGQQWQWSFRLPGKDGRLGTSDIRNVSSDNPLGLNPNDPNNRDDVVIVGDDLHLVVGNRQGVAPLHRRPA